MVNLAVDQQYVTSLAAQYANLNANAYANYQNAYSNYQLDLTSAGPGAVPPVAPVPPMLVVFNTAVALALVVAFDSALGVNVGTTNPNPTLDLTSAITYVQAPVINPPAPVVTPEPNDPVGLPEGVNTATGNAMYLTVSGDTSPAGTPFTDTRGTFVKVASANSLFGPSYFWEKVA